MKIIFRGAVGTVTGSMHELQSDGKRFLLDCGLYQGRRKQARERNTHFPFSPKKVDGVILSHAHIDHSGNLPTLVKSGFEGPILTTPATADLCQTMLPDSGYIQEKDAEYLNKRLRRRRALDPDCKDCEIEPLYTVADVEQTLPLFEQVSYRSRRELSDQLSYEAFDAGHLLGSSSVVFEQRRNGKSLTLAFSGDIGRPNLPIIRDPQPLPPVDYLIMESTYGNRLHRRDEMVAEKLANVIRRTAQRGGKVIIPAFAVGRTQQIVLMLRQLCEKGEIPSIPIFVDSPLAANATDVYRRHSECYDQETTAFLWDGKDPFGFSRLRYIRDVSESKALNELRGPFVVISASGMCEAGRILHHLKNSVENPRNTVLITGFQAEHTLGRKLVEKMPEVPIFGDPMRLRAEVVVMNELSAHADQKELLRWLLPMVGKLKTVFLVHGEIEQSQTLADMIRENYDLNVVIPVTGQAFELS